MTVSSRGATVTNRTRSWEHFAYMGIVSPAGSWKMKQMLVLSVALLLLGSGVWANVVGGSLSQTKGAWASHAIK